MNLSVPKKYLGLEIFWMNNPNLGKGLTTAGKEKSKAFGLDYSIKFLLIF